jgi:hypothetical protein
MSNPPLAGRPPFAIDDDDVVYSTPNKPTRRANPPADNPNNRTSAYNMFAFSYLVLDYSDPYLQV